MGVGVEAGCLCRGYQGCRSGTGAEEKYRRGDAQVTRPCAAWRLGAVDCLSGRFSGCLAAVPGGGGEGRTEQRDRGWGGNSDGAMYIGGGAA